MTEQLLEIILASIDWLAAWKLFLFSLAGAIGMVFSYYWVWSYGDSNLKFREYLLGDRHAVGRALCTLVGLIFMTGGLQFLDGMDYMKILMGGLTLGGMVPRSVAAHKPPPIEPYVPPKQVIAVSEHKQKS